MTGERERIDNLSDARRLRDDYQRPRAERVAPDDHVGPRSSHAVAGTDMNGIEADLNMLAEAERELAVLCDKLLQQHSVASALKEDPGDGHSPISHHMRRAFFDRADLSSGGVEGVLEDYLHELFDVRIGLLDTLASYRGVDEFATAELNRQMTALGQQEVS